MNDSPEIRFKTLLIDAICGVGFPSMILAEECVKVGMAEFAGSHQAPEWRRPALQELPIDTLQELYDGLADKRDALFTQAPEPAAPRIILGH